jgi:chromosome segregation ATPase
VAWLQGQLRSAQRLVAQREEAVGALERWAEELRKAQEWLKREADHHRRAAEEQAETIAQKDARIAELQSWIEELGNAKDWWESQAANWNRTANEKDHVIHAANEHRASLEKRVQQLQCEIADLEADSSLFRQLLQPLQKLWRRLKSR